MSKIANFESDNIHHQRFSLDEEKGEYNFEEAPKSLYFTSNTPLDEIMNTEEENLAPFHISISKSTLPLTTLESEDMDNHMRYVMYHMCEFAEIDPDAYYHPRKNRRQRRRKQGKLPLEQQEPPVENIQAKPIDDDIYVDKNICDMDDLPEDGSNAYYQPSIPEEKEKDLLLEQLEPLVETEQAKPIDDDIYVEKYNCEMGDLPEDGSNVYYQPRRNRRQRTRRQRKLPLEQQELPFENVQAKPIDDDIQVEKYTCDMDDLPEDGSNAYYQPSIPEEKEKDLPLEQLEPPVEIEQAKPIDDDLYVEKNICNMDDVPEDGSNAYYQPSIPEEKEKDLPLEQLEPPVETEQAKPIDDDKNICDMDDVPEDGSNAYYQQSIPEEKEKDLPLGQLEPPVETGQAKPIDDDVCDNNYNINENMDDGNACNDQSIPEEDEICLAPTISEAKPQPKAKCRLFRWMFSKTSKGNTECKSGKRKKAKKSSVRGGLKKLFCCC